MKSLFLIVIIMLCATYVCSTTIYDIQFTIDPGVDGTYPSPMNGQTVITTGIVTAVSFNDYNDSFFISMPEGGAWKGILIFNSDNYPSLGDLVEVEGTVQEYYGFTEIINITAFNTISSGNPIPNPVEITTNELATEEMFESIFVKINYAIVAEEPDPWGRWYITDGSGSCQIDDGFFSYPNPQIGDGFDWIQGIVEYSFDEFSLNPRSLTDFNSDEPNIIHVPGEEVTIQDGINAAANGDTVLVDVGIYVENINYYGKSIIVGSLYLTTLDTTYISQTIIDGNENGHVVEFSNEEDSTSVLTGFTIKNGLSDGTTGSNYGGGIYCFNSGPKLNNLVVKKNTANFGGGMNCYYSQPIIEYITIDSNYANIDGGGIYAQYSNLEIENSFFSYNEAISDTSSGGAICYLNDSDVRLRNIYTVNIENCTFNNNQSSDYGGGISIGKSDLDPSEINISIKSCRIENNSSSRYCGIDIWGNMTSFSISDCEFISNETATYGAAGGFNSNCSGTISNCLFDSNIASTGAGVFNSGGISVWSGANVDFINCTFNNNSANYGAGLTVGKGGIASITNCIFWDNEFDQIALEDQENIGATLSVNYCDIQGGIDSIVVIGPLSNIIWGDGNINENPLLDESCHLTENSPCIDTGDTDLDDDGFTWDNDSDDQDSDGTRMDMGAYYYPHIIAAFNANPILGYNNLNVDFTDLSIGHITNWAWDFNNDGIYDSFEQNPTNLFNSGVFDVKLRIEDSFLALVDTLIKENYIVVQNEQLQPPQNPTISISGEDVIIEWDSVLNANYYLIYKSSTLDGIFELLEFTQNLSFTHYEGALEYKMFYYIFAFDGTMNELRKFIEGNNFKQSVSKKGKKF